ncbi:hypothetical protein [Sphingomonas paucimobilis]|uniref:hypothetical protein n=1 Tax=Sphingomonas paucimobilis TaxID=13689 RepID=UPI003D97C223
MTQWRVLWYQIWPDEEPDDRVAASLDEIASICAPYQDDPFLVIAMYQHRHGQVLKSSIADWLEDHSPALLENVRGTAHAASLLEDAAGRAQSSVVTLTALHVDLGARIRGTVSALEQAKSDLRDQAYESRSAYRALREEISWVRPTLLTLLTAALLISILCTAFLAKRAFADRPGDVVWEALSDEQRRQLPGFISSGSLAEVMTCRLPGMRIVKDRCVQLPSSASEEVSGWQLPPEVAARAAHRWSAERP